MNITSASVHTPTALGNEDDDKLLSKRSLHTHDAQTAKSPFLYDPNALSSLRPDQVPRFFGALTDRGQLPVKEVKLSDLHAMQDRVDPVKVAAIGTNGAGGKLGVVVQHNGRQYVADGHHRLAADWLAGKDTARVHYKDLEPVSNVMKNSPDASFRIAKVDESLGLVFGWAVVCKVKGEDYYDLNVDVLGKHAGERVPEHIPEVVMVKAALDITKSGHAPGNDMHDGPDKGHYPFLFPMTTDIAKAMGITTDKTGLMCAYAPTPEILSKYASGEYTGFSIEGSRLSYEEHE